MSDSSQSDDTASSAEATPQSAVPLSYTAYGMRDVAGFSSIARIGPSRPPVPSAGSQRGHGHPLETTTSASNGNDEEEEEEDSEPEPFSYGVRLLQRPTADSEIASPHQRPVRRGSTTDGVAAASPTASAPGNTRATAADPLPQREQQQQQQQHVLHAPRPPRASPPPTTAAAAAAAPSSSPAAAAVGATAAAMGRQRRVSSPLMPGRLPLPPPPPPPPPAVVASRNAYDELSGTLLVDVPSHENRGPLRPPPPPDGTAPLPRPPDRVLLSTQHHQPQHQQQQKPSSPVTAEDTASARFSPLPLFTRPNTWSPSANLVTASDATVVTQPNDRAAAEEEVEEDSDDDLLRPPTRSTAVMADSDVGVLRQHRLSRSSPPTRSQSNDHADSHRGSATATSEAAAFGEETYMDPFSRPAQLRRNEAALHRSVDDDVFSAGHTVLTSVDSSLSPRHFVRAVAAGQSCHDAAQGGRPPSHETLSPQTPLRQPNGAASYSGLLLPRTAAKTAAAAAGAGSGGESALSFSSADSAVIPPTVTHSRMQPPRSSAPPHAEEAAPCAVTSAGDDEYGLNKVIIRFPALLGSANSNSLFLSL